MSLIVPAIMACAIAYYLATMRLEPAGGSTVPTMPVVVIDVRDTMTPAVVVGGRPTDIMPTSPVIPLATPILIDSTLIYAPATMTVYIPLVMR